MTRHMVLSNVESYIVVHLPWEPHPNDQDQSSFQLKSSVL